MATEMKRAINLKKRTMIFETKSLCVVIPLDPAKGLCYIEPVHCKESDENEDHSYRMSVQRQEWVKTVEDRRI